MTIITRKVVRWDKNVKTTLKEGVFRKKQMKSVPIDFSNRTNALNQRVHIRVYSLRWLWGLMITGRKK